jgi:hypothetical protein
VSLAAASISVPSADTDKRSAARSTLVCKALLYPASGPPVRVAVANISMTGIGLRLSSPLMSGSRYRLTLEAGPLQLRCGVQVVRCTTTDHRTWHLGCTLEPSDLAAHRANPAKLKSSIPRNPSHMLAPNSGR